MVEEVKVKKTRLNAKKIAFINAYTQLGSETFHNGARSARFAGYKDSNASDSANNLLKDPLVSEEVAKRDALQWNWTYETWLQKASEFSLQVDAKHSNAPRYLELIGKSKGFIGDNSRTTNNLYVLSASDLEAIREKLTKSNTGTFLEAQTSDNPATKTITIDAKCSDAS